MFETLIQYENQICDILTQYEKENQREYLRLRYEHAKDKNLFALALINTIINLNVLQEGIK